MKGIGKGHRQQQLALVVQMRTGKRLTEKPFVVDCTPTSVPSDHMAAMRMDASCGKECGGRGERSEGGKHNSRFAVRDATTYQADALSIDVRILNDVSTNASKLLREPQPLREAHLLDQGVLSLLRQALQHGGSCGAQTHIHMCKYMCANK